MEQIKIVLKKCSYLINIGSGILEKEDIFFPLKPGNQAMLVTNTTLSNIFKNKIFYLLKKSGIQVNQVILADGEEHKTLDEMELIISALLKEYHSRDTTLIALGGGVIGDITGFAASVYQRGVRFIQIPTTLLSQVDASIGGKTGVNHIFGKNMIGSFWQPSSVIIDLDFLSTLPYCELVSGMAEVIKYAIAFDANFFNWLEENVEKLLSLDYELMLYCIKRCCEIKAKIVSLDEKENNIRMLLNLGHTYGHAIETNTGYGSWLHGQAISVGIVMASRVSELLGYLCKKDRIRILSLLKRTGLPIIGPKNKSVSSYFLHMMKDKKNFSGIMRLVLPVCIGQAEIHSNINKDIIVSAIKYSLRETEE
ncbi:MAG: 3-dehydroquinate synthase [Buchnera aphidicola (Pentalonia nigronervosa)]|jgi:3-dehydroquinate synthase|uniref:3-dehydroquinate synthase n=1 Tax=Buchnera aphidicola (Pentalonia nigronervosa) TaxID=1309793 RepID=A0A7H1AZ07_9GAMM|nr:MAG: 3-dehydroquinate synthase [Buchnera aphidicola (Pentalonia nigronervosa)]